jgi:hypothetical protein
MSIAMWSDEGRSRIDLRALAAETLADAGMDLWRAEVTVDDREAEVTRQLALGKIRAGVGEAYIADITATDEILHLVQATFHLKPESLAIVEKIIDQARPR